MTKPKVLVIGGLREDALGELKEQCDVTIGPVGHRMAEDREWVIKHISAYDGLIVSKMKINEEILAHADRLKIISTYGVGYDHIDLVAASKRKIIVSNCPKSVLRPTAELALTMILACARRLHYYDHSYREGVFLNVNEYDNQGYSIQGKTLGILGMGRIGTQVARFGKMLGMKVIYHNRHEAAKEITEELDAKFVDQDTLLKESDFVSLNLPLTKGTEEIIDAAALKKMKKTAFLINVARGKLVNQAALIEALKDDEIAGAGLDVYEDESKTDSDLASLDNVILTPHVGSATHQARYNLSKEAAKNIISYLVDHQALNQLN